MGGLNKNVEGQIKPLSSLYKCVGGKLVPLWESGNFRTADGYIFVTADNMTFNVTI